MYISILFLIFSCGMWDVQIPKSRIAVEADRLFSYCGIHRSVYMELAGPSSKSSIPARVKGTISRD